MPVSLKNTGGIFLAPAVMVGLAALALYLAGLVPAHLQPSVTGIKEYTRLEAAEAEVGFAIAIPAYFPSYLAWPPARILGQREPAPTAQLFFRDAGQSTEALYLAQARSDHLEIPLTMPWLKTVRQETPVDINGNGGVLVVGITAGGQPVNGVRWQAGGFYFVAVTTHPARELLTMVRSMHLPPG